jgi:hypothetical protein
MNRLVNLNTALKSGRALFNQSFVNSKRPALASFSSLTKREQHTPLEANNSFLIQKKSFQVATAFLSAQEKGATTEKVVGTPEKFEFLAETKQLLNIVAKSLYSDKEVFVRELISNASDAIEKLKYAQLSGDQAAASSQNNQIPFEIKIDANDINNTLTIQVPINKFNYFITFA